MTANYVLLAVENPAASATFYQSVLGTVPLELSPTFALLKMNDSTKLGLWSKEHMQPPITGDAGSSELAMTVEGREDVDALHAEWSRKGMTILQKPAAMDFGYTFTAADPDGHRLRVFTPEGI